MRQEKLKFPSDEHEPQRLRVSFIEIERIGARIVPAWNFLLIENGFAATYERIIHRCHYGFGAKRYGFPRI